MILWDCMLSMRKPRTRESKWFIQGHMVTMQQSKNSVCDLPPAPSPYWKSRIGYGWSNCDSNQGRSAGSISQAGLGSSSSREHLSLCILWNCAPGKPSATIHVKEIKRGEDFPGDLVVQSLSLCDPMEQHTRLSFPSPCPRACSNSCPLSQWYHPTISSSAAPFSSSPQSFPASVFPSELALRIRWPKYWSSCFIISPCNERVC